jgi:hypothetical protein
VGNPPRALAADLKHRLGRLSEGGGVVPAFELFPSARRIHLVCGQSPRAGWLNISAPEQQCLDRGIGDLSIAPGKGGGCRDEDSPYIQKPKMGDAICLNASLSPLDLF